MQSRAKIRSFYLAPIFETDSNFGGSQSNWRHFEVFRDGLKNKTFDHFLNTTGLAPNGADFTPSVFFSYHGKKNYGFKDQKQQKSAFFVIFPIL